MTCNGIPLLGPILFLIYINDFPEYLTHSKLRLFADDSIIYKEITCQDDCKKLQSDLDAAARWETDWLMAFHPDKCTVLTITQKKTPFKHDYKLHNHILEPVTSAKYLGVTLQSNLKWNTHIDNITSNGNKSLGYLKRNLQISNPEVKSRTYQALVRPKLEYSCSIWDPYTHRGSQLLYFHIARYMLKEKGGHFFLLPKVKVEFWHLFSLQKRFSLCSYHNINANIVVFC